MTDGPVLCYRSLKANPRPISPAAAKTGEAAAAAVIGTGGSFSSSVTTTKWQIKQSACMIRQFRCKVCTRLHQFRFDFSKNFWGGVHRTPSPDPSPDLVSGYALVSGFALKTRALRTLDSGFSLSLHAVLGNRSRYNSYIHPCLVTSFHITFRWGMILSTRWRFAPEISPSEKTLPPLENFLPTPMVVTYHIHATSKHSCITYYHLSHPCHIQTFMYHILSSLTSMSHPNIHVSHIIISHHPRRSW